ncbi:hydrogen peroxide-dependent heme synthase [Propionibacterium sp.]|uniref:hydrogen peroxide-dependent heme synthase n=1 Tax=Propionibacterium sp. TaxID=1977903 RepID=UPI0039ED1084
MTGIPAGSGPAVSAPAQQTFYAMYSVFKVTSPLPTAPQRAQHVGALEASLASLGGLHIRGWYHLSGLRADADVMVWWWATEVETLQDAYHRVRSSEIGASLSPVWSAVGVHRQAEFNAAHVPAFMAEREPLGYLCVYPFDRSYDWYVLPEAERRTMLAEHGRAAQAFPGVQANTIAAFGLGDYEWLLGLESDELVNVVDLIRHLRATGARLHVRNEIPFFTGPRMPATELFDALG